MKSVFLLIMTFGIVGHAQAPASQQKPCSEEQLIRTMAETRAETAETKVALKQLRIEQVEEENNHLRNALSSAGQKIAEEQNTVTELAKSNESAKGKIADLGNELEGERETVNSLRTERNKLAALIKAANGRWMCEAFKIGCVKLK